MNLLYIGNRLSASGKNATGIEILGPLLERSGYHLRYASSKKYKVLRLLQMLWMTLRARNWADAVLIDTYSTSNYWYAVSVSQLCRVLRLRYIPILHGGNLPIRLKNERLSRLVFGRADVCVAPSGFLHKAFSRAGFNVIHIPNPVDTTKFQFKERLNANPRLIWVRSLTALYNPMMALRTLKRLQSSMPDASLLMVGYDGGLLSELTEFAAKNNLKVEFAGRLSQAQWADRARDCDIFLNTSNVDNAPFSLIEALSIGLFVVSTNVGGIPFLVSHEREVLLVNPEDDKAMADAVLRIIGDRDLQAILRENGRQLVTRHSPENVVSQWVKIIS
jgi:glycosyltransferase involved in cell wall biosynthesis